MFPLILFVITLYSAYITDCSELLPTVEIPLGVIQGTYKESFAGRQYAAYEGIPYALQPIMERRFEPPVPVEAWNSTLFANKQPPMCIQYVHEPTNGSYPVEGQEDCLYLNIYVPINSNSMPVLFSIHGGAYQFGSGNIGSKYLMDRDIIVVSLNYRLGPFGFLSTEDEVIPGNMGLKDQSLALRWVSENIKYFGGNANKITLIGLSAGAASVHYQYLSPMSKGLFHSGISFSGTAFGPGKTTEHSREKAKKVASILDCPTEDIRIMVHCLRTKSAESISRTTRYFMPFLYNPFTPFGPVVEKHSDKPFVDRSPIEIINSGDAADVPWIQSVVSEEGLYPAAEFINNPKYLEELNNNWIEIAPHLLDFNFTIPLKKHAEVSELIRQHYLGSRPINKDTVSQLIKMISDRLYVYDANRSARLQAEKNKSPVYLWYHSYRAHDSLSNFFSRSNKNFGVSHGDNYYLLFENPYIDPLATPEDHAMQIKIIDLVASVAEIGYPVFNLDFEWRRVDPNKKELGFLHVAGPNNIRMSSDDNLGEEHFWSSIGFDENRL